MSPDPFEAFAARCHAAEVELDAIGDDANLLIETFGGVFHRERLLAEAEQRIYQAVNGVHALANVGADVAALSRHLVAKDTPDE
jgi:hypothetical protein